MTWEYAAYCFDERSRHGLAPAPDYIVRLIEGLDKRFSNCGPHRVVRRQVGDWEEVPDER